MAASARSNNLTLEDDVNRVICLIQEIKSKGGVKMNDNLLCKLNQLHQLMTSDIFATVRQVYEKVYESVQINGSLEMKASAAAKATSAILISAIDSAESTLRLIKLPASGREGLGFNIMGGKEQGTCILVSRIIPGGIADKQGHLRRGDQLLSINGVSLNDQTHAKAVQLLKQATDGVTILVSYQPKLLQEIEERTDLTRSRRFN